MQGKPIQLYMITNRRLFPGDPDQARSALLKHTLPWVQAGLRFLQVREKDLPSAGLRQMAVDLGDAAAAMARSKGLLPPHVLINVQDEQQIKVACEVADGVHLPGDARPLMTRVGEARALWLGERPGRPPPMISASCHTVAEVEEARMVGVSVILFAPVFEKPVWAEAALNQRRPAGLASLDDREAAVPAVRLEVTLPGVGLEVLRAACAAAWPVPVFALGGVTLDNAADCLAAGAAGIAGIRLFAGEGWRKLAAR